MSPLRTRRRWQLLSFGKFFTAMAALACLGSLCVVLAFPAPPSQDTVSPNFISVLPGFWTPQGPAPIENGPAVASPNNQVCRRDPSRRRASYQRRCDLCRCGQRRYLEDHQRHVSQPHWTAADRRSKVAVDRRPEVRPDRSDPQHADRRHRTIQRLIAERVVPGPVFCSAPTEEATWRAIDGGGTLKGSNISDVAVRGSTILATADTADSGQLPQHRDLPQHRWWRELQPDFGDGRHRPSRREGLRPRRRP